MLGDLADLPVGTRGALLIKRAGPVLIGDLAIASRTGSVISSRPSSRSSRRDTSPTARGRRRRSRRAAAARSIRCARRGSAARRPRRQRSGRRPCGDIRGQPYACAPRCGSVLDLGLSPIDQLSAHPCCFPSWYQESRHTAFRSQFPWPLCWPPLPGENEPIRWFAGHLVGRTFSL